EMVFIRAPWIDEIGPGVEVLARDADRPVLVRDGRILIATFHPELTTDTTVHEYFLKLAAELSSVDSESGRMAPDSRAPRFTSSQPSTQSTPVPRRYELSCRANPPEAGAPSALRFCVRWGGAFPGKTTSRPSGSLSRMIKPPSALASRKNWKSPLRP